MTELKAKCDRDVQEKRRHFSMWSAREMMRVAA
jgi:hypothetical protein